MSDIRSQTHRSCCGVLIPGFPLTSCRCYYYRGWNIAFDIITSRRCDSRTRDALLRHGFDGWYGYGILALLAASIWHSENRAIVIVIVRRRCDCQQWLRPPPTLACVTKTHHMHGMHIEALRQLGVAGVTHTRAPCVFADGVDNRQSRRSVVALGAGTTQPCIRYGCWAQGS